MEELIKKLKNFFEIHELVDQQVYEKYGEKAWRFFDPRLLETLLFIRIALDKPITINNWYWKGVFDERGLRTNVSPIVKAKDNLYLTPHLRGAAIDFDVKGMAAGKVRAWLLRNQYRLPHKIRLEYKYDSTGREINWVHLDVDDEPQNPKVYLFNV